MFFFKRFSKSKPKFENRGKNSFQKYVFVVIENSLRIQGITKTKLLQIKILKFKDLENIKLKEFNIF